MKIITLNTWGGKVKGPFNKFIKKYANEIDVLCFQEVFDKYKGQYKSLFTVGGANSNLFDDLTRLLDGHTGYFSPVFLGLYGTAVFINKNIEVSDTGSILVYENPHFPDPKNPDTDHDRNMQWVTLVYKNKKYLLMNVHGHWVPGDKQDNEARIEQSKRILQFASQYDIPQILCGDFNLRPDTKSVAMLEEEYENLVKTHHIQTTRTSLYKKTEKFADYIFVSPRVKVKNFQVMQEEVSDHKALYLEFQ